MPVRLVPRENTVHVFDAQRQAEQMESANGVPNLTSFFQTIYKGMRDWYLDNYEGKINAAVQIFGTPFSLASNLFNIIIRVYQVGAVLGLQNPSTSGFFRPMAISGLVVAILEAFYHLYGLTFQLKFAYEFYTRKDAPEQYFAYLFHKYLGISREDRLRILAEIDRSINPLEPSGGTKKKRNSLEVFVDIGENNYLEKMIPLARRIQPWLVGHITRVLDAYPLGLSEGEVTQLMELIKIQIIKKIVLHVIALTTIVTLGAGLLLAMMSAAPLVSVILLTISPILTAVHYFYEYGFLDRARWDFSWINCIPDWIKWIIYQVTGDKLEFTAGEFNDRFIPPLLGEAVR